MIYSNYSNFVDKKDIILFSNAKDKNPFELQMIDSSSWYHC